MRLKATLRASLLAFACGFSLQGWAAITGNVFQDFNSNGIRETTATIPNQGAGGTTVGVAVDAPLANVSVRAVCVTNAGTDGVVGTADDTLTTFGPVTTDASGNYSITTTGVVAAVAPRASCRVEFSWNATAQFIAPANVLPNPLFGMRPTFVGTGSNTATQFVNDGAQANLGLNYPADFCQNNPNLVVNCFRFGDAQGTNGTQTALHAFPYNSRTTPALVSTPATTQLARVNQIGSTWGIAYHKPTDKILTGAYFKRHIGVGPGGLGQIYSVNSSGAVVSNFVNLETLIPGSAGTNPRAAVNDYDRDAATLVGGDLKVGKLGLGDLELSDDQTTLYAIGLNSRALYVIPVGTALTAPASAAAITQVALPDPGTGATGCPADATTPAGQLNLNLRPFALKYSRGALYVGMTCTAESTAAAANLRAFVYRYDGATFTQVLNTSLNYGLAGGLQWNAWNDAADSNFSGCCFQVPQPLLTDIEFSRLGDMILGVRDRNGDATGRGALALVGAGRVDGRGHGDIIRSCISAAGTYSPANCTPSGVGWFQDSNVTANPGLLPDPNGSMGGMVQVPGFPDIVQTAKDPVQIYSGGVVWHNTSTGTTGKGYEVLPVGAPDAAGIFPNGGKASGLGDLEALCNSAPLEVGNRVWLDANGNGVQDPGEAPVAGVTVRLYASNGTTVLATALTDANGQYAFSNRTTNPDGTAITFPGATTPTTGVVEAIPNFNADTTGYSIRLDNPADYAAGGPLSGLSLSPANTGGVTTNDPLLDLTDSDAILPTPGSPIGTGNFPRINFNAGAPGENNFGLDAGFTRQFSLGNRLWFDTNNNGLIDAGEQGTPGVLVELLNATGQKLYRTPSGDLSTTAAGNTPVEVTTDAAGYYRFDNLPPNGYVVSIPASNWGAGRPLAGYQSSTTTEADPNSNVDSNDNGLQPATAAAYTTGGVRSGVVTLGPASDEPTNDTDRPASYGAGSTTGTEAADNQSNLSVDFGFYRLSVGNVIWRDDGTGGGVVNNGTRDGTEPGIAGVTVELLDGGGNVVAVTTTDASGIYAFTQQTAGGTSTGTAGAPLLPGNYTVRVPGAQAPLNNLASSADPAGGAAPLGADNDDNGTGTNPATGATTTTTFALAAGTNAATGAVGANPTGTTDQPRVDLGFAPIPTFSLGNRVFSDPNNNGRQDAGEPGFSGVQVRLLDSAGAPVAGVPTQTTDANGYYRFDNLPAGTYIVEVVGTSLPAGATSSTGTATGDQGDKGLDAAVAGNFRSGPVQLGTGLQPTGETDITASGAGAQGPSGDANTNSTIDFGFVPQTFSIGNRVFLDPNNNGRQDAGENGVPTATVVLRDNTGAQLYRTPTGGVTTVATGNTAITATTDANGYYRFDGLPASATGYVVGVVATSLPAGVTSSTGTQTGDQGDKGADAAVGGEFRSAPVPLGTGLQPTGETDIAASGAGAQGPGGDASTNSTIDFGFVAPNFSVGNRIFSDPNNNGRQDAGEPGLPAVQVRLLDSAGAPVAGVPTQTTDANGYYRFDNLPAGTYIVEVIGTTLPAGASSSTGTATGDQGDKGLDASVAGNFRSGPVQLGAGLQPTGETDITASGAGAQGPGGDTNTNSTIDFGFVPPTYSIGNRVWADVNNDGLRATTGEPGIDGVVMSVYAANAAGNPTGPVLATTTTANGGYYRLDNLAAGDYVVLVDPVNFTAGQPLRSFQSSVPTEASPNTDADNNDNGIDNTNPASTGIRSGRITLGPGTTEPIGETDLVAGPNPQGPAPDNQANMTVDFGFYPLASLGDRVFLDTNGNGVQDAGETGVPGVVVKLLDGTGNPVLDPVTGLPITTTTDSNGNYTFANLPVGSYQVEFVVPSGYGISPRDQGGNDATDSDVDPATRRTPAVTLGPGENNTTLDAGIFFTAALGDRVWHDLNKNGIQDAGEPGVPGVTVTLTNSVTGTVFGTATTDATGNYNFTGLIPGVPYVATFSTLPAGYQFTPKGPGGSTSDPADSDVDPATGRTDPITLVSGQNDPNWDAGIFGPIDLMLDKAATPVLPATGSPYLTGDQIEFTLTLVNNGPATALAGYTMTDLLPAGFTSPTITSSTGFAPCAFAGQTLSCTGTNNLAAGVANALTITYRATIGAAAGTLKNIAYADKAPADPSVETIPLGAVPTPATNASSSPTNNDADVSIVVNATTFSLGNRVWVDTNNNGVIDAGESGRDGVAVELIDVATNTVISSAMTAGGGYFRFDSLPAGDYIVQIAASNFSSGGALGGFTSSTPTEANPNSDVDSNDNGINTPVGGAIRSGVVTLGPTATEPAGETDVAFPNPVGEAPDARSNLTVDFGFVPPASLGNVVFRDTNGNGIQDAGETGVPGVTVTLYDGAGNPIAGVPPQVTDGSGNYLFTNLPPGTYTVGFSNLPASTGLSPANVGANDAVDSDADPITGRTGPVTLAPGETNLTVDAGIVTLAGVSIGNFVWRDNNGNGIQDAGEPGVAGVTATVARVGGGPVVDPSGNPVTTTAVTDANGAYQFTNLAPGAYTVTFSTLPAGFTPTITNAPGSTPANDSNGLVATSAVLTTGQSDQTLDLGLIPPATPTFSIGNRIFSDPNNNGRQDAGELGLSGVQVRLLDSAGAPVAGVPTQTTDANGYYRFDNLPAGTYIVEVVGTSLPAGATSSTGTATGDQGDKGLDAAVAGNFRSGPVQLGTGLQPTGETDIVASGPGAQGPSGDANTNSTIDFGFVPAPSATATVTGTVFADPNRDSTRNPGEGGVPPGTVVQLVNPTTGAIVATTTTDANGNYTFTNVPPGPYNVVVPTPPGGTTSTTPTSVPVTATAGTTTTASNIGFGPAPAGTATVSGTVFADPNRDGTRGPGEGAVPAGTVVQLVNPTTGAIVATTTTDANGNYVFTNVPPGNYNVVVPVPPGGTSATTPTSVPVTATVGTNTAAPNVGFGPAPAGTATVAGTVFADPNRDGTRNPGEGAVPAGTVVQLVNPTTGAVVATTTTDANGNYVFTGVPPGNYNVVVPTPPGGTSATTPTAVPVTATAGTTTTAPNVGFGPASTTATVTGTVFADPNRDGVRGPGEGGVPAGTVVQLVNPTTGAVVASTTTDANGNYTFANVVPGPYNVVVPTPPGGTTATTPTTVPVTATAGTTTTASNIGFGPAPTGTATVTGTVFADPNRDGTRNPGEPGVPAGTVVQLVDPVTGAVIATAVTDANGNYTFTNVPPGNYNVRVPTPPAGTTATTPTVVAVTATNGTTTTAPNIGFGPPPTGTATINGTVFTDTNRDGVRNPGEGAVPPGTVVRLVDPVTNAIIASTVTDVNGNYTFANIPAGTYNVVVPTPPNGTSATTPNVVTVTVATGSTVSAPNVGFGPAFDGLQTAIPTMSEWGMIIMTLLLMMFGARRLNRRIDW